jgi:hypothetical protein
VFGPGLPDLVILLGVAGVFFGSPDPGLVARAPRLERHAFALWSGLSTALAVATLAVARGAGW